MNRESIALNRDTIAHDATTTLVAFKAVPFFMASLVYIDGRKLISYPRFLSAPLNDTTSQTFNEIGCVSLEGIASREMAAIPFEPWIADHLSLAMQHLIKKAKGFGINAQIEGEFIQSECAAYQKPYSLWPLHDPNFRGDANSESKRQSLLRHFPPRHISKQRTTPVRIQDEISVCCNMPGHTRRGKSTYPFRSSNACRGRRVPSQSHTLAFQARWSFHPNTRKILRAANIDFVQHQDMRHPDRRR